MPTKTEYAQGTPNWVDMQTTDQGAAKVAPAGGQVLMASFDPWRVRPTIGMCTSLLRTLTPRRPWPLQRAGRL